MYSVYAEEFAYKRPVFVLQDLVSAHRYYKGALPELMKRVHLELRTLVAL